MKERLIKIYELNKIDKELQEIESIRGDLPSEIEEMTEKREDAEANLAEVKQQLSGAETSETQLVDEIQALTNKIDKNDNILRSGGVKSNIEYDALAKEIDDAYEKMGKNETVLQKEVRTKKTELTESLAQLQKVLDELNNELKEKQEELTALKKQTEEEEAELNRQREELVAKISPEDLDFYERINIAKPGDAVAIVRKGSCLGCYNSIPPQRVIEIKMADRFFNCESCGRILISEDFVTT
jgi:uncharacterized protein